jgi:hypothetical protein
MYTHAFDIAIISPAALLTGIYLWRRAPLGYLLAAPMLVMCTLVGAVVIAQTIAQTLAGIRLPMGIYIGSIGSWVVLGAFAIWLTVGYLRSVTDGVPAYDPKRRVLVGPRGLQR